MQLVFATRNPGKLKEMRALLQDLINIKILSAQQAGVAEAVMENGATLEQNALKKARFVAKKLKAWSVADDSGLHIKALNNAPGIYSARWAGEGASEQQILEHTLNKLKNVPRDQRQACFKTIVALASPDARDWTFAGQINGTITTAPLGRPRPKLPYDLIFIPHGHTRTFSEMTNEEKNTISHRSLAFRRLKKFLISFQGSEPSEGSEPSSKLQ